MEWEGRDGGVGEGREGREGREGDGEEEGGAAEFLVVFCCGMGG